MAASVSGSSSLQVVSSEAQAVPAETASGSITAAADEKVADPGKLNCE